jgi:hypothetical protein
VKPKEEAMGKVQVASALAIFLLGTAMAAPAAACGKTCTASQATPAAVKKPVIKKSARGYGDSANAAGGNIDDYWSPCNSDKLTDYMYCQP